MIIRITKNPESCEELSHYLGFTVKSIERGDSYINMDGDIDLATLNVAQKLALKRKIMLLPLHVKIEKLGNTYDVL